MPSNGALTVKSPKNSYEESQGCTISNLAVWFTPPSGLVGRRAFGRQAVRGQYFIVPAISFAFLARLRSIPAIESYGSVYSPRKGRSFDQYTPLPSSSLSGTTPENVHRSLAAWQAYISARRCLPYSFVHLLAVTERTARRAAQPRSMLVTPLCWGPG